LLFLAFSGGKLDLWRSSGTSESTVAVGVPQSASSCSDSPLLSLTVAGSKAFYLRREPSCKVTLWATDGTAGGTLQLPADVVGGSGAQPTPLIAHQGSVLFFAFEGNAAFLWKSDGTPQGTGRAFDLPAEARAPAFLTSLGAELYFVATDSEGARQVWKSDGTTAGTKRLTGLPEDLDTFRRDPQFARAGTTVFFRNAGSFESGLWATDGTLAGSRELLSAAFDTEGLVAFQGALYFFAEAPGGGLALWRSDGTPAGTVPVKTLGYNELDEIEPVIVGNRIFFVFGAGQRGIWTSDGTAAGTRVLSDVFPQGALWPAELTAGGGKLYFTADDGLHGTELWESDGTEAGTRMVQDIFPLSNSSNPSGLTVVAGRLFFAADDGVTGPELWALPLGPAAACQPSPTHLCLGGGRFRVEAHWKDFSGNAGQGQAVALTPDTGYFWFFAPTNVETIVKVLDGRGVNEHHWVFYGALSNVEYSITVTDTETGRTRRYFNPSGQLASVGDSRGFGPSWDSPEKSSSLAEAAPLPLVSERTDPAAKAPCVASAARLCLNGNRFAVEVSWKDFSNNTGTGKAVALTGDTGYFWFFDAANVELVLKVLDGRPVNNKFWVFYGALSSVEYTVTVTDTETGAIKTYQNPSGRLGSVADTTAF
ncbi:MAG TPA: ELWxxDGT repeat protein, partial [Thermoanaerobaculia bacterium]